MLIVCDDVLRIDGCGFLLLGYAKVPACLPASVSSGQQLYINNIGLCDTGLLYITECFSQNIAILLNIEYS